LKGSGGVSSTDPEAITAVNELVGDRFALEVERDAENRRFQAALAEITKIHEQALEEYALLERRLDTAIWQEVDENRATLIERGKRSFITMMAKFQLRDVPAKVEVLDKLGIMETARNLGVVRQIANPPKGEWRFNQKKFLAWLDKSNELHGHFEQFIDHTGGGESLTVQPNANYTVLHDSKRVSPPSISIKKS